MSNDYPSALNALTRDLMALRASRRRAAGERLARLGTEAAVAALIQVAKGPSRFQPYRLKLRSQLIAIECLGPPARGASRPHKNFEVRAEHFGPDSRICRCTRGQ